MEIRNIYLRKDGRWEGRISKGKNSCGKRRYHAFFGKTKNEVKTKMKKYKNSLYYEENSTITVVQLFNEWFQSIIHRVKESTAANYQLKANKHILPEFGSCQISSVTPSVIYDFIRKKQLSGLSNRYISDILIMMKSIFKYASLNYHIANPMEGIVLPKKAKPDIRLLNTEEQCKLERYISENQNNTTLGIALTLTTGLRIGELCSLQWEDIDLEKRILTVKKTVQRIQCRNGKAKTKLIITAPKSESSKRDIPIPEFMIDFLKKFQRQPKDFLLSGNENITEPRTMQYRFAKILKNVKLPSVHFHSIRHLFASNCIKLGFDVKALSEILGHSSVEITLNRYVHSSFEQKAEYMNRLKMVV